MNSLIGRDRLIADRTRSLDSGYSLSTIRTHSQLTALEIVSSETEPSPNNLRTPKAKLERGGGRQVYYVGNICVAASRVEPSRERRGQVEDRVELEDKSEGK